MKAVGHKHIASEWRLFIDSNKTGLKGVLLHNGNKFPFIPVASASHLNEGPFAQNRFYVSIIIPLTL